MKKLFVFVPVILLVLFLINSFVLKEKETTLKSTDNGKTWQVIREALPEVEKPTNTFKSAGVLISTGSEGIRRSTDNGKHWEWVIREGGVGIAIERIEGGFAAIAYNTTTKSRRIHISLDNGATWKVISDALPPSMFISSIKQKGKYLICGHPDGIFRSADMGKTWGNVHPGVDVNNNYLKFLETKEIAPKSVYRIHVSGNALYAVPGSGGC
ncbi:MAG: exo-alpha-sialidase [Pedobacter sp.]|nr:MAG: exo-alpha-sialidase [Pedobacter sp.]